MWLAIKNQPKYTLWKVIKKLSKAIKKVFEMGKFWNWMYTGQQNVEEYFSSQIYIRIIKYVFFLCLSIKPTDLVVKEQ